MSVYVCMLGLRPASSSSSRSSMSAEDTDSSQNTPRGPFVGTARAVIDCTPSPYDKEALAFKV